MIDKMPIKTTFGPEEGKGTINFQMDRAYSRKEDVKNSLTKQITDNSNKKEGEKQFSHEMDNIENARGKQMLANQRQRNNNHMESAKEHWKNELARINQFKQRIPKGSDVVNKLKIN